MERETYVTIKQAQALKRLGFDWDIETYYICGRLVYFSTIGAGESYFKDWGKRIPAPEFHVVQKWLREIRGIAVNVAAHDGGLYDWEIVLLPNADEGLEARKCSPWCKTYEEALSEGIDEALEVLEEKI